MRRMLAELASLPDSEKKSQNVTIGTQTIERIEQRLAQTPRGTAHLIIDMFSDGESIDFRSHSPDDKLKVVFGLIAKFGTPSEFTDTITDEEADELMDAAMNDSLAWEFLKRICSTALLSGKELPPSLLVFSGAALIGKVPKTKLGRSGSANAHRDLFLVTAANFLENHFGLQFSRGPTSKKDSVCSILSEVMAYHSHHMDEEAIRKAITKRRLA